MKYIAVVLLLLCLITPLKADVVGDEVDDLMTSSAGSNFITTSAGTVFVITQHSGTLNGGSACYRDIIIGPSNNIWGLGAEDDTTDMWAAKHFDGSTDCAVGTFSTGWATLTWRHGGGNLDLFINGVLANTVASGNSTSLSNNVLMLWDGSTANAQYPGPVAMVALYNTALTDAQITAVGNSFTLGVFPSGATGLWDFQGCVHGASVDTVVFPDRSGNGRTITADNGANNTGMTCAGSRKVIIPWGVQ